jgi:N-acyl-D-aspartate/D-glutamate deacylase
MKREVARAMEQGAFGLSSSLIYPPGSFAATEELVELARVAAGYGGIYATHVRGESDGLMEALEEAFAVGERAGIPVEIWHLKAAGRKNWGRMGAALSAIREARGRGIDVTADVYPYAAAATDLSACLPPSASAGGVAAMVRRLKDPAERARIRREIEAPAERRENLWAAAGGAEGILVTGVRTEANRKQQGRRLSEVAAQRRGDPLEVLFDLLVEEEGTVDAVYFLMSEEDVRLAVADPSVAFNCDAPGVQPEGALGARMIHPRAYGSFPRILGRYVREEKLLSLEEAVRKMTSLPARRLGLHDRGLLRPGLAADITVFDPARIADRATFEAPHRLSEGIVYVLVNGEPVVEAGRPTGRLPGRVLRGPGYARPRGAQTAQAGPAAAGRRGPG